MICKICKAKPADDQDWCEDCTAEMMIKECQSDDSDDFSGNEVKMNWSQTEFEKVSRRNRSKLCRTPKKDCCGCFDCPECGSDVDWWSNNECYENTSNSSSEDEASDDESTN